jgi:tetratricopeptide (TPR) repeat protein
MGLIGQIVQGPRLTGAFYADLHRVVLTAQLTGDPGGRAWRADALADTGVSPLELIDDLVAKLASQIFADVVLARSVRWQAVFSFSQGLHEYRECLPEPPKHPLRLRRASGHFVDAIADSDQFDLAYYNFGVVALALGQAEAAESAFLSAITRNSDAPQGYYAIAQQRFDRNNFDPSVAAFCDRVIDLRPNRLSMAQAYDLKALSQTLIAATRNDVDLLKAAVRDANRAALESMLALLGAELKRTSRKDGTQVIRRHEVVASSCYSTVAFTRAALARSARKPRGARFERWLAARALGIAISANKANPHLYQQLAGLRQEQGRPKQAVEAILKAARMRGDDPEYWADAALLLAERGDVVRALQAAETVFKRISMAKDEHLHRVHAALLKIGRADEAARVRDIWRLRRLTLNAWTKPSRLERLIAQARHYREIHDGWREGFLMFFIANVQNMQDATNDAITTLAGATKALDDSYPGESSRLGLRAFRAELLASAGRASEALEEIDAARRADPLSTWEGEKFARICMHLEEWGEGARAWKTLLVQETENADRYMRLAWCLIFLALEESDPARRRALHFEAESKLRDAVELALPQERGSTHYVLGYAFTLRGEDQSAIPHLQVAKALDYAQPLTLNQLANSCLGANRFDESVTYADDLIRVVNDLVTGGHPPTDLMCPDCINTAYPDALLAWAYNAKAYAAAEKAVALAESHEWVAEAKAYANKVTDKASQLELLAAIWDTEGWILVREGDFDGAMPLFQKALAISATADRYWHLAVALDRKAASTQDPTTQIKAVRDAVECCERVNDLDLWEKFSPGARLLKTRLEHRLEKIDPLYVAADSDNAESLAAQPMGNGARAQRQSSSAERK